MYKRGETITQYVMILGLLLVGIIVIVNLKNIFISEANNLQQDSTDSFFKNILWSIEKTTAATGDSVYVLDLSKTEEYFLTVSYNKLNIYFPTENLNLSSGIIVSDINIIPNSFTTSGKIIIVIKRRNMWITNNITCNIDDGICDPGCINYETCDPDCYKQLFHDSCISYCVDADNNTVINQMDIDGVCDPDCYNTFRNGGIYDPDCLLSKDGICDPDTNMVHDGYCDTDCLILNGVCDPDCREHDPDCPHKGDGICDPEILENCIKDVDCYCENISSCRFGCTELNPFVGTTGCVATSKLKHVNDSCTSSCECADGLICKNGDCIE